MSKKSISKILLVEDEPSLRRLYYIKLIRVGYKVETAEDGRDALKKVKKFKPELILLDIILPKVDGFAVLKELKKNSRLKKIPVILLTNLGQDEDMEKGQKLGAIAYLVKTQFTPSEIVKEMEKAFKENKKK